MKALNFRLKKIILLICLISSFTFTPKKARADFWGADIPILLEILSNTIMQLMEMRRQARLMESELAGINNLINRFENMRDLIQTSNWQDWSNPTSATRKLNQIYHLLPTELKSTKSREIELELARAMELSSRLSEASRVVFLSGEDIERRASHASPGVANKLSASALGTIIKLNAQNQVAQSQVVSLLTKILAETTEREARSITQKAIEMNTIGELLSSENKESKFSENIHPPNANKGAK